ncbi:MAG: transaldolase [Armatimonadetes bacterium]|nr:transaldolase [Armatimonadota bacterium]
MTTATTDLHSQEELADLAAEIVTDGFSGVKGTEFQSQPAYEALVGAGSELWLDTGDMEAARKVWAKELSGLTTNNNLVNQVVQTGSLDQVIGQIGKRMRERVPGLSQKDLIIEAAFILNAKIALGLVETFDAKVSVELHPDIADDWRSSLAFGKRYYALNPGHLLVKAPITPDGYIAVRKLSEAGVPINFTLGFSARQNYFAALFSRPRYVNVFLGRLGSLVDDNGLGDSTNIGEHVTLVSQEHIEELRGRQQAPTRQIAASIRSGQQVAHLAGVDVQTIPPKAAQEYLSNNADAKMDIRRHSSAQFPVQLNSDPETARKISTLWEVPDNFKAFTAAAVEQGDSITEGSQILELAKQHGVNDFFRSWSEEELQQIEAGGKIPKWSLWGENTAPDEMMSVAALRAFTKDQRELDGRIQRLIGG